MANFGMLSISMLVAREQNFHLISQICIHEAEAVCLLIPGTRARGTPIQGASSF